MQPQLETLTHYEDIQLEVERCFLYLYSLKSNRPTLGLKFLPSVNTTGIVSGEEKQMQACNSFQLVSLNRHQFMAHGLPLLTFFTATVTTMWITRARLQMLFPMSPYLDIWNVTTDFFASLWAGWKEILINVFSSPIRNTWLLLATRWMDWYIGNSFPLTRTWHTKILMIKSLHVRESMSLLWKVFQTCPFTNKASPATSKALPCDLREAIPPWCGR